MEPLVARRNFEFRTARSDNPAGLAEQMINPVLGKVSFTRLIASGLIRATATPSPSLSLSLSLFRFFSLIPLVGARINSTTDQDD